ncbi:MAG: acyltransferase [Deltaproteobacteria bacterium]|nr:acyltransferase [Deltaproteobacteria bacterium]
MKIGFIQTAPVFGEIKRNVDNASRRIALLDAELIVLPELFSTGYRFKGRKEALGLAEDAGEGYASTVLLEAAKAKKTHIVAGFAERKGSRVYNSAMLIGPKGLIGVYRKAHLFWDEKKIFDPGDTPLRVHDIGKARVGMMICFDWVFPEVCRTLALRGADIIAQPSNLVLPYCPAAMITRSIENRVYSITANRVGTEERKTGKALRFIGSSQIAAPDGTVLAAASKTRPGAASVEIDVKRARDKKITPMNDLFKDRRADLFDL